jgi:hypothetical protein
MIERALPDRWGQTVVDLDHEGFCYRVAVSQFADGSPAAITIDSEKSGSALQAYGQDVAVLLTLLLQSGLDMPTIERALVHKMGLAAHVAAAAFRATGRDVPQEPTA